MKNLLKLVFAVLGVFLALAPASGVVTQLTGFEPVMSSFVAVVVAVAVILISAKFRKPTGMFIQRNDVSVEIWVAYIISRLWKDNQFLSHAFNEDDYVKGGAVVHIPQPGAKPVVRKNRSSYPAAAVRRTDTDIVYVLDEYTTDPTHIVEADKVELSYDKITSVFGDHAGGLVEAVADDIIYKWLNTVDANARKMYTSGIVARGEAAVAAATTLEGTTGNRLILTAADFRRAQTQFNNWNIAKTDRKALVESNMLDQLVETMSETKYRDFSQYLDAKNGIVGRLYGFDIMDRSSVAIADASDDIKAVGAAVEEDDNLVSMFWQKDAVARAMGTVKFFENPDRAEYYGDIYSALMRMGGRRRRADGYGVLSMVQGTPNP